MKISSLDRRWRLAMLAGFVVWIYSAASLPEARGQVVKNRVSERVESHLTALRTAGVNLTDADFEAAQGEEPPANVAAAGPAFVAAWREYRRASSLKKSLQPQPSQQQRGKNVLLQGGEYERLVKELLDGDKPPTPEQIAQFFYTDYSWCGTDSVTFSDGNQQAILLACLRHRRWGEAVGIVLSSSRSEKLRDHLLTALGFDWRKVVAGAWLAGKYGMLESLCKDPSDEIGQLVLRWAELHWDAAVAKRAEDERAGVVGLSPGPQLPKWEMLHLLAPGNSVSDATKTRIAAFLHANATRLYDAGTWIRRPPPGTEQWLKPIARAALQDERNEVRRLGEKVLRSAGEVDAKAELRPPARYRLFTNGKLWPDAEPAGGHRRLGISVKHGPAGSQQGVGTSVEVDREGVITPDPDLFHFHARKPVTGAYFYAMPSSLRAPASTAEPWIRAEIPLPPAFGETTDLRIELVEVTIQPRFPRPAPEYQGRVSNVGFTWAKEGRQPDANSHVYHLAGEGPLVLSQVQPGEYWLQVRAPGAALGKWEKISITHANKRFEPRLEFGASVSIPLRWPEALKLEDLDPDIADFFRRRWWAGLPTFFTIERNGQPFPREAARAQDSEIQTSQDVLALENLPVGKYRARLRSSAVIRAELKNGSKPERRYSGWKAAEVSFEVNARSPREVTTEPLKIESTR